MQKTDSSGRPTKWLQAGFIAIGVICPWVTAGSQPATPRQPPSIQEERASPRQPASLQEERALRPRLANGAALRRWLDDRQQRSRAEVRRSTPRRRPGDSPELFGDLWEQRVFDRMADLHRRDLAWDPQETWTAEVLHGTASTALQAVGALLRYDGPHLQLECTGTLVGPKHFITARHCAVRDRARLRVFMQHEGLLAVSGVARFCDLRECDAYTDDLAVLVLERPALTVQPMVIASAIDRRSSVSRYEIAGFGVFDKTEDGVIVLDYAGIKHRAEEIQEVECPETEDLERTICYSAPPLVARRPVACNRDSGGPLFANSTIGDTLFGVTRHGASACQNGHVRSVRLAQEAYQDWLATELGLPAPHLPSHVVMRSGKVSVDSGVFLIDSDVQSHSIHVEDGADMLLVTLNHETYLQSPAKIRFDLKLRGPDGSYRCTAPPAAFSECRIANPETGEWAIEIHKIRGEGLFQLTALVLQAAP